MRLHHLEVTAFGPYADTQTVDFDTLNEAGVFLLTGPTGAGKTSILDAVCYALYSVVPGDREVRGLRSDHAPADRAPRVELELTLGGRRLRVVRTPEWRRPKRRGTGTTKEQASARLFEIDPDGTERLLSDRAQEVGHELGLMLGMTSEQFMQVVLLPQSGFQTFLKARSDERRDVLEKLFATQRFSRIEEWMHERARVVRDQAQASLADVRTLLAVLRDRSGAPLPDELEEPLGPDAADRLTAWVDAVLDESTGRVADLAAAVRTTADLADAADDEAATARRVHALVRRRDRARADLAELEAGASAAEDRAASCDADRRAQQVAPLLRPLDRARSRAEQAATTVRSAEEALGAVPLVDADEPADPGRLAARLAQEEQSLRALRGRATDLERLGSAAAQVERSLAAAEAVLATVGAELEDLPGRRTALERDLASASQRVAGLASALTRHDEAAERLDAARLHAELLPRLSAAEVAEQRAHGAANDARSHALDLVARRLEGIAAELAAGLVAGEACQVCGSTDHPVPASVAVTAVTEADQAEAQARSDQARVAHEEARRVAEDLRARTTAARLSAGGLDESQAQAALREADAAVHEARAADGERRALTDQLDQVQRRLDSAAAAHARATAEVADLRARLEHAREARAAAAADLRDALDAGSDGGAGAGVPADADLAAALEARIATVTRWSALARAACDARAAAATTQTSLDEAQAEAESAARKAGFESLDHARSALLDPAVRVAHERLGREREAALARAQGVLAEPEVAALDDATDATDAADAVGPVGPVGGDHDLAAVEESARVARQAHARVVAQHEQAEQQLTALRAQADQLARALATWAPAETEAARVGELAGLVRGTGGNRLRMRLSSYVLATRLDQVLDAANARLGHMRDTRYLLRRTDKARRANAQAGLDLEVLDEWTGDVRPPSSLSGGECFVVSLALALGLADVIGEESGGVEVDTLFIDEGFGTLDPETLDQVMDRIDDLRSGGRAVGVVSHVSELRTRITTQLHVRPSRAGSCIAIAHGDA